MQFQKNSIIFIRTTLCYQEKTLSNCAVIQWNNQSVISGSKNVHKIKSRVRKPVEKLVSDMLFPKKTDTLALRYRRKTESTAAKEYESLYSTLRKKLCKNYSNFNKNYYTVGESDHKM